MYPRNPLRSVKPPGISLSDVGKEELPKQVVVLDEDAEVLPHGSSVLDYRGFDNSLVVTYTIF